MVVPWLPSERDHSSNPALLAAAVAEVDGIAAPNVALTATTRWLTVRLTRELWGIEERHVEIARRISSTARAHGAVADRSAVQEVQFAVAAKPESIDRRLLACRPGLRHHGAGQRHRPARPQLNRLDAGHRA